MEKKNCSFSYSWKMKKKHCRGVQKRVKPRNLLFLIFSLLLVVQKCGRVCISESGQAQSVIGFAFFICAAPQHSLAIFQQKFKKNIVVSTFFCKNQKNWKNENPKNPKNYQKNLPKIRKIEHYNTFGLLR